MANLSAKTVRKMAKEAIASVSSGPKGACIIVRGPGTVTQCVEMTRGACDALNEKLDNAGKGFTRYNGDGTKCVS